MPMTISDQLLYCAVRLANYQNREIVSTGTGFFYKFEFDNGKSSSCIITNKHVVDGAENIGATVHVIPGGADPKEEWVPTDKITVGFLPRTINHPTLDLCAIPVAELMRKMEESKLRPYWRHLTGDLRPSPEEWQNFDSLERVVMVGCPRGLYDEYNGLPIFRSGWTASPLHKDHNGEPMFMVDMACFPGSSGSPIFCASEQLTDRKSGSTIMGQRWNLVGILFAGPTITQRGEIVFSTAPHVNVSATMHLGLALKSSELEHIKDQIKPLLEREAAGEEI